MSCASAAARSAAAHAAQAHHACTHFGAALHTLPVSSNMQMHACRPASALHQGALPRRRAAALVVRAQNEEQPSLEPWQLAKLNLAAATGRRNVKVKSIGLWDSLRPPQHLHRALN